jgi:hypothetical protein
MGELPLRDIHLPGPVSWWPPAPGWWLLVGLALGALVFALLYRMRLRVRRVALRALGEIERSYAAHGNGQRLAADVSALLRRVCLTYRPRETVASLTGNAWRAQLLSLSTAHDALSAPVAEQIVYGPYNPAQHIEPEMLMAQTRLWLKALPPLREVH